MSFETEYADGSRIFRNSVGVIHHDSGPAIIHPDGTGEVWINGRFLYKTPVEPHVIAAADIICTAYKQHRVHEAVKPGGLEYHQALERWYGIITEHNKLPMSPHKITDAMLIIPQM